MMRFAFSITPDELVATLAGCGTSSATAKILVDPLGVIFDSRTGAPIAGARVTLIDAATGAPARVFDFDGVTPAPSTVVTGADGAFRFPSVNPGNYRLDIVAPQGYFAPSKVPPTMLPTGRFIDPSGSYGGEFSVTVAGGPIRLDVPLDGPQGTGLFLQKAALVRDAEIGGTVEYALTLKNVSGAAMTGAVIRDTLPRGFSFVKGTARRDAATSEASATALPDPTTESDRTLVFSVGDLAVGSQRTIRYRVRIGAGSVEGRAINRARASGATPIQNFESNEATAEVRVRGGVFTTRAILIGKIWIDTNRNQTQERDEVAVPGVRVFLENGNYAVSDRDGKYSIYGALPLTHIVKVDAATLPSGAVLEQLTTMHAKSGRTAFADLKNGEMQKVDFALINATEEVTAEVARRVQAGDPNVPELDARLRVGLPVAPQIVRSNDTINRSGPASGTLSGNGIALDGTLNTSKTVLNPIERERDGAKRNPHPSPLPSGEGDAPVVAPAQIDSLKRRTASQGPLDGNLGPVPSPRFRLAANRSKRKFKTRQTAIWRFWV